MADPPEKLKLGKGTSFFVKTQLRRLSQEDDTWEADFFPIPCSESEHGGVWWGLVLSHSHENVLAQRAVEEPPTVNDLANLLAEAMRRPLVDFSHRPRCLYLRARPEWAELLPHLKQIGIEALSQEALPTWDRAFGDLYAQVEQAGAATGKGKPMARSKKPVEKAAKQGNVRLYTLDVFIVSGPVTEKFAYCWAWHSAAIDIGFRYTKPDHHDDFWEVWRLSVSLNKRHVMRACSAAPQDRPSSKFHESFAIDWCIPVAEPRRPVYTPHGHLRNP